MTRGTGFTILTESGQRTGPKLEIRVVSNEQHILRKRLTSDSDNKLQATVSTALTIPGPGWVQGPAPWHGDGARNGAAVCFNCRHQLADTGQQAGLLTSSHDSEREMPSKLWPHDSDIQHRRSSVRHLPSQGPEWVRSPAPRHGDGARNGAAACTTYCLDNARSRAAGATAFMQHPDPGPRTTCTPPVSSPARCRATGGKAKYGTESPWLRWWFAAHLAGGPTPAATKASAAKH